MALHSAHQLDVADAAALADVLDDLAAARDRAFRDDAAPHDGPPASRLVHVAHLPPRPPRHAELSRPLPAVVAARLDGPLWSHQAEAIDLARAGRSVVVATGTASGKSRCYQVPLAEAAAAPVR